MYITVLTDHKSAVCIQEILNFSIIQCLLTSQTIIAKYAFSLLAIVLCPIRPSI